MKEIRDKHIDSFMIRISEILMYQKIKLNYFYFARTINGAKEQYISNLKNAKETDLFILGDKQGIKTAFNLSPVRYFYQYDNYIIGRIVKINKIENYKKINAISINAYNFDYIFSNTYK